eukprot:NODE_5564_length_690_cov_51.694494_g5541_i0.p1 GENE.NODE_5564_length_690_cov_51.694494_g5541_i0~~NODE_5564_length_690_cov_51.694494_g5541_i0.p1  ORF type:complete len:137 (-),score=6.97 NODE_5564_length_690_cov_51.694494_g5541_i0:191-601(-)
MLAASNGPPSYTSSELQQLSSAEATTSSVLSWILPLAEPLAAADGLNLSKERSRVPKKCTCTEANYPSLAPLVRGVLERNEAVSASFIRDTLEQDHMVHNRKCINRTLYRMSQEGTVRVQVTEEDDKRIMLYSCPR